MRRRSTERTRRCTRGRRHRCSTTPSTKSFSCGWRPACTGERRTSSGCMDIDLSPERSEAFYQYCKRLGTTLQVPEDLWPADLEAFDEYWEDGLRQIQMDDVTRGYLQSIAQLEFLTMPLGRFGAPLRPLLRPLRPLRDARLPARAVPPGARPALEPAPAATVRPVHPPLRGDHPALAAPAARVPLQPLPAGCPRPDPARAADRLTAVSPRRRAGSAAPPACPPAARRGPRPAAPDRPQPLGHGVLVHAQTRGRAPWAGPPPPAAPAACRPAAGCRRRRRPAGRACAARTRAPGPGPWSAAPAAPRRRSGSDRRRRPAGGSRGAPPSPRDGWSESPPALRAACPAPRAPRPRPRAGFTASGGAQPAIRSGPIGTSSAREPPTPAAAVSGTEPVGARPTPRTRRGAGAARSAAAGWPSAGRSGAPSSSSCTVALRTASALRIQRSRSSA